MGPYYSAKAVSTLTVVFSTGRSLDGGLQEPHRFKLPVPSAVDLGPQRLGRESAGASC
jgi:hypothetical protein